MALDKKYRNKGVVVLGVSSDDAETQRKFAQSQGITYPLLVDNDNLPEPYSKVGALPTTFIIDRKGILREVVVGYAEGKIERIVEQLLQEEHRQ